MNYTLEDFEHFKRISCNSCNNDWYCPTLCDMLLKAKKIPFEKIEQAYQRHEGDMVKVFRYIKQYRLT